MDPVWIDISLFIGCLIETRNYRILSLVFILPVNLGSLKRIYYSKLYSLAHTRLLNVFSALKGTNFYILFVVTALGVVLCGSAKKHLKPSDFIYLPEYAIYFQFVKSKLIRAVFVQHFQFVYVPLPVHKKMNICKLKHMT